jgi:hypothetical protein
MGFQLIPCSNLQATCHLERHAEPPVPQRFAAPSDNRDIHRYWNALQVFSLSRKRIAGEEAKTE